MHQSRLCHIPKIIKGKLSKLNVDTYTTKLNFLWSYKFPPNNWIVIARKIFWWPKSFLFDKID